jgi:hypothetical protein
MAGSSIGIGRTKSPIREEGRDANHGVTRGSSPDENLVTIDPVSVKLGERATVDLDLAHDGNQL